MSRIWRKRGQTSVMIRIFIPDNTATNGAGLTGLTSASTNLTIAYMRELDGTSTTYTGANIEAQTTIGTFQAPSSSNKIRFKAVDATNFPGLYELQFHDSATAFGTGDISQNIAINIYEATTTALKIGPCMLMISLVPYDPQDGVRMGLTAMPIAAAGANAGLPVVGTQVPNATAGAAGGLAIVGSNMGTVTLADGVAHGGTPGSSTATLSLAQLNVTSDVGDAIVVAAGGAGGRGMLVQGSWAGEGIAVAGGLSALSDVNLFESGVLSASLSSLETTALAQVFTTALTESYAADGAAFTLSQALYMVWSLLAERFIVSTTLTAKKLDGSTAAMTFTLDSATVPTSQTRAT